MMTYEKMAALMHNMDRVDMANLAMVALDQAGLKGSAQATVAVNLAKNLGLDHVSLNNPLWFEEPEP